jgi:tRNA(Ile2) C34 agmatinyltransferase TiaS
MSGFFDSNDFEFKCPLCKRAVKSRVADLKRTDYRCPNCRGKFDTSDFKHGVDKANREIERFKQRLGNIKIDIIL